MLHFKSFPEFYNKPLQLNIEDYPADVIKTSSKRIAFLKFARDYGIWWKYA
jgi:hypothetical protein